MSATTTTRAVLAGVAVLLASLCPPAASASPRTDLNDARQRLRALDAQVRMQEAEADRVHEQLMHASTAAQQTEDHVLAIRAELRRAQRRQAAAQTQMDEAALRVRARARAIYVHGPMRWLDLVLTSSSASQLTERIAYASRLLQDDAATMAASARLSEELAVHETAHEELIASEVDALWAVREHRRSIESLYAEQHRRLENLASDRAELGELIDRLQDQLRASELASARRTAGRGTPMSFGDWGAELLRTLGAPVSQNNLVVVVAWQTAEHTRATWNPLATTMPAPAATTLNSHGVRNYVSMEQGIDATIRTLRLRDRGYEAILDALYRDADPMQTASAINASRWCRGCANGTYVTRLIPAVQTQYARFAAR